MPKYILLQTTTFKKHVTIEANSLKEALEKARSNVDLYYSGTDTPDFETKFKPDLNWGTKK